MGPAGRILYVDLTTGVIRTETLSPECYRKYPGGSCLAMYLLWKHCPPGADPLGPGNPLIFAVSPTTGLQISGQSRMVVAAKSPVTGGAGDSQCGGYFPAEMRAAGVDALVFLGRSPEPVYLFLKDGSAELRPARHLWGKETKTVEAMMRAECKDDRVQIAQVGPAGENQVRFASVIHMASRAAGRTGMGAVMGSKNLKAVVVRGTTRVRPALQPEFQALSRRFRELFETNPAHPYFGEYGTAGSVESQNYTGGLPTRNYQSGFFEGAGAISGQRLHDELLRRRETCFACGIRCKRVVEAPGVDPAYGGPEYETIATFGSYCGVSDLVAVVKASQLCNQYGMDTISCGATVAFAMECFERGILTREDTGGLDLRFGNAEAMLALTEMIGRREGLGNILAEGSARAAKQIGKGAEDLVVAVKGSELPAHMPQVKRSLALIYAVNPFGADHMSSDHDLTLAEGPDGLSRKRIRALGIDDYLDPRDLSTAKVRFAYWTQLFVSAIDTFCLCQFVWGPSWQLYGPNDVLELVRCATGWETSMWELMTIGERRLNLMRQFNAREGLSRKDDKLPKRLFEPLCGGPTDGVTISPEELERAKDEYYAMAGWDVKTGTPTPGKLKELGLDWLLGGQPLQDPLEVHA
ncbi:MAG TPA: aldehyde ferredoxin oxidoreductase family protein [Symbiobacteriaceae bacterium]